MLSGLSYKTEIEQLNTIYSYKDERGNLCITRLINDCLIIVDPSIKSPYLKYLLDAFVDLVDEDRKCMKISLEYLRPAAYESEDGVKAYNFLADSANAIQQGDFRLFLFKKCRNMNKIILPDFLHFFEKVETIDDNSSFSKKEEFAKEYIETIEIYAKKQRLKIQGF